jgi:hypothetical protein
MRMFGASGGGRHGERLSRRGEIVMSACARFGCLGENGIWHDGRLTRRQLCLKGEMNLNEPKRFRKKPVVIEAIQWTGDNLAEVLAFTGPQAIYTSEGQLIIHTLEGDHTVSLYDQIIKGVKGECYPCKPDIFELTYDAEEKP